MPDREMYEKETNNVPVHGRNAVSELLQSGISIDTVFLAESLDEKSVGYFTALGKQAGAVVKHTRTEKLNKMCEGGRHQGVAVFAAEIDYCEVEDLLQIAAKKGEAPFLLLIDGAQDPQNLGALIRSAFLCGVHGVVLPKRGTAPVTPAVMKASAGAAAVLPVARVANLGEAIRKIKKAGVFVYCADMQGMPLEKQNLTGAIALVMGGEGAGVSHLVKKLCDDKVSLPMAAHETGVDSFNVSVAGGIIMYDIFKRR